MAKPMELTANDTFPTTLTFTDTDPVTKIKTPTDITGHTIALEIDYGPDPLVPLVKTAVPLDPPEPGKCKLPWAVGDLKEGEWQGKLTVTNAADEKLSTKFLSITIEKDITPPVVEP